MKVLRKVGCTITGPRSKRWSSQNGGYVRGYRVTFNLDCLVPEVRQDSSGKQNFSFPVYQEKGQYRVLLMASGDVYVHIDNRICHCTLDRLGKPTVFTYEPVPLDARRLQEELNGK